MRGLCGSARTGLLPAKGLAPHCRWPLWRWRRWACHHTRRRRSRTAGCQLPSGDPACSAARAAAGRPLSPRGLCERPCWRAPLARGTHSSRSRTASSRRRCRPGSSPWRGAGEGRGGCRKRGLAQYRASGERTRRGDAGMGPGFRHVRRCRRRLSVHAGTCAHTCAWVRHERVRVAGSLGSALEQGDEARHRLGQAGRQERWRWVGRAGFAAA